MHTDLERLIRLQRLDDATARARQTIADMPAQIAALETRLADKELEALKRLCELLDVPTVGAELIALRIQEAFAPQSTGDSPAATAPEARPLPGGATWCGVASRMGHRPAEPPAACRRDPGPGCRL